MYVAFTANPEPLKYSSFLYLSFDGNEIISIFVALISQSTVAFVAAHGEPEIESFTLLILILTPLVPENPPPPIVLTFFPIYTCIKIPAVSLQYYIFKFFY